MDQSDPRTSPTATKWGIYFSISKDLVIWTTQRLLIEKKTVFDFRCGDPDPMQYPSVIDHTSTSRNFETTGARAYLYYTVLHYPNCQQTLDRDLVSVPISISK